MPLRMTSFRQGKRMNEIPRVPKIRPTTRVADGVPRLRWTLAEFERLAELGFFTDEDRIELIGGELVPMAPKGNRHELVWVRSHSRRSRSLPAGGRLPSGARLAARRGELFRARFPALRRRASIGQVPICRRRCPPPDRSRASRAWRSTPPPRLPIRDARRPRILGRERRTAGNSHSVASRLPQATGVDSPPADERCTALLIPSLALKLADLRRLMRLASCRTVDPSSRRPSISEPLLPEANSK